MDFTVTVATPAPGVAPVPSHNSVKAPDVERAVKSVTGETPTITRINNQCLMWRTWGYQGFAYPHPNA